LKSNIHHNTKWVQNGVTVAGGNGFGKNLNQLSTPCGLYVDDDQIIYVADSLNHRIIRWTYGAIDGQVIAGGNGQGNEINQLNTPIDVIVDNKRNHLIICDSDNRRLVQRSLQDGTDEQVIISNVDCCRLAIDDNGYIYISDGKKNEVRRWKLGDTNGTLVAGGNGKGDNLNQLNNPTYIFVDENHSVYVSDRNNHRVLKWMEGANEGLVVAGNQGEGNNLMQLACPEGVIVDHLGNVYVADYNNHRIMRWCEGAREGNIVVGGHGRGEKADQLNCPVGLSFDRQGNLYVADWNNQRIQRFDIDGSYDR
jgi:sugar lactone lactonase YvrE